MTTRQNTSDGLERPGEADATVPPRAQRQFHDVPATYLAQMRAAIPVYDEFQAAIADAAAGIEVQRALDLGAGTGETTLAILGRFPDAVVTLLDKNPDMLVVAVERVPADRVAVALTRDFADPLPAGPFDLVVSSLAVHHLDDGGKSSLFRRVRTILRPCGRFVMGDIVVPARLDDRVTPFSPGRPRPRSRRAPRPGRNRPQAAAPSPARAARSCA